METWAVIGASRGIGKEFVKQLLARGHGVIATIRQKEGLLMKELCPNATPASCQLFSCDMLSEASITVRGESN